MKFAKILIGLFNLTGHDQGQGHAASLLSDEGQGLLDVGEVHPLTDGLPGAGAREGEVLRHAGGLLHLQEDVGAPHPGVGARLQDVEVPLLDVGVLLLVGALSETSRDHLLKGELSVSRDIYCWTLVCHLNTISNISIVIECGQMLNKTCLLFFKSGLLRDHLQVDPQDRHHLPSLKKKKW